MRKLTPAEQELWQRVTATIEPLSRNPETRSVEVPAPSPRASPSPARTRTIQPERPKQVRRLDAHGLDGHWERRIKSGSIVPDRILDLHGHTLDQAWTAIDQGLERAILSGDRIILLITGHARQGEPPIQRGKIRAAVNDWLAASRHASEIAAVRGAHRRHGGGGSLYIILRR